MHLNIKFTRRVVVRSVYKRTLDIGIVVRASGPFV